MRTHSGVLISSVPSRSSLSVHTSDGLRQGYFLIVASLVNHYSDSHLSFSSYTMPLILAFSSLRGELEFRRDRRESPQFLQVYFAAVRDSTTRKGVGTMLLLMSTRYRSSHHDLHPFRQQHDCVRWCHHLCLVLSCRQLAGSESTRFLSECPVGHPTALEVVWCGTSPARPQECCS